MRRLFPAALVTTAVALANGFPLTYYDSASYLKKAYAFTHASRPLSLHVQDYRTFQPPAASPFTNPFFYRPAPYTLFLVPFADPATLWLLPFVQGLLAAFVVGLALRTARVTLSTRAFVGLFAALTAGTSLPWFTGQVMPDLFTGLLVLLAYVTLFGDERLARWERAAVWLLLALALATHLSHLPLYAALLVAGFLWCAAARTEGSIDLRSLALRALTPLLAAAALLVGCNYVFTRKAVLSESSSLFYLARLAGDGTAQRYLARACPEKGYLLCAERSNLPEDADYFLWEPAGAWTRHQNDPRFLAEASEIVRGTLRQEWPAQIAASLRNAAAQLAAFSTDLDLHRSEGQVLPVVTLFGRPTLSAYRSTPQFHHQLPLELAGRLQVYVTVASLLLLLATVPWASAWNAGATALVWMVLCGVVLNAAVLGALSSVHDRYQSRVVWLVPLAAVAVLMAQRQPAARRHSMRETPARPRASQRAIDS